MGTTTGRRVEKGESSRQGQERTQGQREGNKEAPLETKQVMEAAARENVRTVTMEEQKRTREQQGSQQGQNQRAE